MTHVMNQNYGTDIRRRLLGVKAHVYEQHTTDALFKLKQCLRFNDYELTLLLGLKKHYDWASYPLISF